MHPDSGSEFDSSSSSCSAASPGGDTPGCSQQQQPPPDSQTSSVGSAKSTGGDAADSFVPTVTAISTSPALSWMVQPAVVTSVPPSSGRLRTRSSSASSGASQATRAKSSSRKGLKEKPSKEEEERRRIRRERNKIAAAKCRNRRRELIDTLQAETDKLEDERSALQTDIQELLKEKERLELLLDSHQPTCKMAAGTSDQADHDDPPASPQLLLSMLEDGKALEGSGVMGDASSSPGHHLGVMPCIPAAAILGNSNILLCSSAEDEPMEELKGDDLDDLDDLVPSLEMAVTSEMAASVPDIDLSGPFSLPDWETLYKSVATDFESLNTPLMSASPACSSHRTVFTFSSSDMEALAQGGEGLKTDLMKESLHSPTLLAL